MLIRAIAIDDEPKALEVVRAHASRISFLHLERLFTNPFEAVEYLHNNPIELIFLDVRMPDISGLELLNSLNKGKFLVIFTTAYAEFALQSYDVEALDYLLKPFDFSRFFKAVAKAQDKLKSADDYKFFFVNTGNQQRRITLNDILHIEGNGNYVTYHVQKEKVTVRSTIRETLSILPRQNFIQIHKSHIVSLAKIIKIQDNHVFVDGHRISIGARYRENLMKIVASQ
jgi:two-component system, LytTR family, response regulator